jgi:DNA polymerase-3 subunit alpha
MHEYFSDISSYDGALLPGVKLPSVVIDQKYYQQLNIDPSVDNFTFLRTLCERSLVKKNLNKEEYKKRLEMELGVLNELGFVDYVLLNWDFINFCHVSNILVGSGRGSAASSLVLFLIGVTDIDPIKHGLIFERFVNKARAKIINKDGVIWLSGKLLCDVDSDVEMSRRQEVIRYIENKNIGKTCKILTINTLSSKLCIKEVGKIVGRMSEDEVNHISSYIPKTFGKVASFDEAISQSDGFRMWAKDHKDLIDVAKKLAGLQKNTGVHPSGIAVSYFNVDEIFPLRKTKDGDIISSYDMGWVSEFAVKFDILGLRTLSVVEDVCKSLNISLNDIDPNDILIYKGLESLRAPHGLFQIEAGSTFDACKKIKPKTLDHLSGVIAISRPGACAFIDQYADYTNNGVYKSIHSFFDEFLSKTGGVCLYQEDLLKMIHKVGFDLTECDPAARRWDRCV